MISVNSQEHKEFKIDAREVFSVELTARQILELRQLLREANRSDKHLLKTKKHIWSDEKLYEREQDVYMRESLIHCFLHLLKTKAIKN